MNSKIRAARLNDDTALTHVHIQAWQESYKGILPQDYLDQLPANFNTRLENWRKSLTNPERWIWVTEGSAGVNGFSLFGLPRDPKPEGYCEMVALYLLDSQKGRGLGYELLKTGFVHLKSLGFKHVYCWVLENNPTIKFYKQTGGRLNGTSKEDAIGSQKFKELMCEWDLEKVL